MGQSLLNRFRNKTRPLNTQEQKLLYPLLAGILDVKNPSSINISSEPGWISGYGQGPAFGQVLFRSPYTIDMFVNPEWKSKYESTLAHEAAHVLQLIGGVPTGDVEQEAEDVAQWLRPESPFFPQVEERARLAPIVQRLKTAAINRQTQNIGIEPFRPSYWQALRGLLFKGR